MKTSDAPSKELRARAEHLPEVSWGPYTSSHLVKWCAAQLNWDKIHYDADYAREAGLGERLINGALKQHLLVEYVRGCFPGCWIAQLDYRFTGPDHVGDSLALSGQLKSDEGGFEDGMRRRRIELSIVNGTTQRVTTTAEAVIEEASPPGEFALHSRLPHLMEPLFSASETSPDLLEGTGLQTGDLVERLISDYPIDLSRLRLFADAVGNLDPVHYDLRAAEAKGLPGVVAPPLFPIHAIELRPGKRPLSHDPRAMGREGVSEVGRGIGQRFGQSAQSLVNGGNKTRIHSLATVGERVEAQCVLKRVQQKLSEGKSPMLIIECLNSYHTTTGRLLMEELISVIHRPAQPLGQAAQLARMGVSS